MPLFHNRFFVPGTAKGKARGRAVNAGAHARVYPSKTDLGWKAAIRLATYARCNGIQIDAASPVRLALRFQMQRPRSHFGTGRNANKLKPTAPTYCLTTPDLDNSEGAVMDAITESGLWIDDKQVCDMRSMKVYTGRDEVPGVWIDIEAMEP